MQHVSSNKHDKAAIRYRAMIKKAEDDVRNILLELHHTLEGEGERVAAVELDTRNFANFAVTIHTERR